MPGFVIYHAELPAAHTAQTAEHGARHGMCPQNQHDQIQRRDCLFSAPRVALGRQYATYITYHISVQTLDKE